MIPVPPHELARLIILEKEGTITHSVAKEVLKELWILYSYLQEIAK